MTKHHEIALDKVPLRGHKLSTKRPYEPEHYTTEDQLEKRKLDKEVKKMQDKHRPKLSIDAQYLEATRNYYEMQIKRVKLTRKESMASFFEENKEAVLEEWMDSEKAQVLEQQEASFSLEVDIFKQEAARRQIGPDEIDKLNRRSWMQLYTMSPSGLGMSQQDAGMGQRDPAIQSSFRTKLIEACNSRHPDPLSEKMWCPVLGSWIDTSSENSLKAAHMFPYELGQTTMHSIFGMADRCELNEIENGLMLSSFVEEKISAGLLAIVPDVPDSPSVEEIKDWHLLELKPYKIRVLDANAKGMDKYIPCRPEGDEKPWKDLDGQTIQFLTDHRPRARYLYWQYCTSMLRLAWRLPKARRNDALKKEFRRGYWGTKGRFMKKGMLMAFVEEMGHEYEHLLEGAIDETAENDDIDSTALIASGRAIRGTLPRDEEDGEDGEDEDEGEWKEHECI